MRPFEAGIRFEDAVDEVAVLFDQVVEREEEAFVHAEPADHGARHAAGEEDVRIIAAVEEQAELFGAALIRKQLKFELDVRHILEPVDEGVVFPAGDRGMVGDCDAQGDIARVLAELVGGQVFVVFPLGFPGEGGAGAAEQQRDGQRQTEQLSPEVLDVCFLLFLFI